MIFTIYHYYLQFIINYKPDFITNIHAKWNAQDAVRNFPTGLYIINHHHHYLQFIWFFLIFILNYKLDFITNVHSWPSLKLNVCHAVTCVGQPPPPPLSKLSKKPVNPPTKCGSLASSTATTSSWSWPPSPQTYIFPGTTPALASARIAWKWCSQWY